MKDALLAEYDHEMATTRRLLERVPESALGWKPHDKSMTLGQLAGSHREHSVLGQRYSRWHLISTSRRPVRMPGQGSPKRLRPCCLTSMPRPARRGARSRSRRIPRWPCHGR